MDGINIELLCDRCDEAAMLPATVTAYYSRMRNGRNWYLDWLAGHPEWWRHGRRYRSPTPSLVPAAGATIGIPIRPGIVVTISMPSDRRRAEADIVHAVLLNMIGGESGTAEPAAELAAPVQPSGFPGVV